MNDPFYWRHARDSVLTEAALRMFQILATFDGQAFDDVKGKIDATYLAASGSSTVRHGGIIQTQLQAFREAGWVTLDESSNNSIICITPAGHQALQLLVALPDFLKAAPYFIVEIFSRYQLNNPARPPSRNPQYDVHLAESDIFPYWTLLKIMRECGDEISADELRRFVFQIKKQVDIDNAIAQIRAYRSGENIEPPAPLQGAIGEPKYLMGRLGTQVGGFPALVEKEGATKWKLNQYYLPFIDQILKNEPTFHDYLDEKTWMHAYSLPVNLDASHKIAEAVPEYSRKELECLINDDDPVFLEVKSILATGCRAVLFSGPPGTSKSWYARQVAAKLAEKDGARAEFVQFHPSLNYDDFVEGYIPRIVDGKLSFEISDKVFLNFCSIASKVQPSLCVLVIDEINRGDTSRIFGELLTYLETDYRNKQFRLSYSGKLCAIPDNLVVIGTFNPFDKSVVELDDAIDRRFERLSFDPSAERLKELLARAGATSAFIGKIVQFFNSLNIASRHGVGHVLFMNLKDDSSLRHLWNRKLRFVLEKSFRFEPDTFKRLKNEYAALFDDQSNLGMI